MGFSLDDIKTESSPLESTGGKVWSASIEFANFLFEEFKRRDMCGSRLLELGSGCGWLGMRMAKEFPGASVTMSEQSNFGALAWLEHNVALNPSIAVSVAELDWAVLSQEVLAQRWDMIIGAELVYSYEGAKLFASVVGRLLKSNKDCICFYAHSLNRFESVDACMLEQFRSHGLSFEIVYGEAHFDLESIGQFSELFKDLKLVIFKLSLP